jgi:indole-3-glycerol phosphate synthase
MDILDRIVEQKHREVQRLPPDPVSPASLRTARAARGPARDFLAALRQPHRPPVALIAEIKRASPSAGIIRPDFDPVAIARTYAAAGADCLSVLTDVEFFQGSIDYLRPIRDAVGLPILRKDFIVHPRQIRETLEAGADAILLIAAILDDDALGRFLALSEAAGLTALVEVHDTDELDRVQAIGAQLIGVNNRNLKSFGVDLATTERLAARLGTPDPPPPLPRPLLVAESGLHTRADIERVARCGAQAVLIGESLMRHPNIAIKVCELMGP